MGINGQFYVPTFQWMETPHRKFRGLTGSQTNFGSAHDVTHRITKLY
jgi:hypothetical protein